MNERTLPILYFSDCCNYTYLKNFSKLSFSAWYRIVILVQNIVSINDSLLHSVSFVSNILLPPEANVLRLVPYAYCHVTSRGPQRILYLLPIVDQNGYAPHKDIIGEQRYRYTNS
jgi:hypothetical protein